MRILEQSVEQPATDYAEKIGYISLKFTPTGQRGWPDHLFINLYGHHVYIEFKKPKKKPSKLQLYRLKQLTQRGVSAYWTDNLSTAKKILDDNYEVES